MAKVQSIKMIFEPEELEGKNLGSFFRLVAETLGVPFDDEGFKVDCTKVNVSTDIQDGFYKTYRSVLYGVGVSQTDIDAETSMLLIQRGPKAYSEFPPCTVEIIQGAFLLGENELDILGKW